MFEKIISLFSKKKKVSSPKTTSTAMPATHNTQIMTKAYFSPGEECTNAIINALKKAQKSVDICVFTISDDKISKEIGECYRRKIKVRILTDNEKLHDLGSDIERLSKMGIEIRIDNTTAHMHHKFMIVDNATLVNGSYNWTKSAALSNQENIIVSNEKALVTTFYQQFEKMWKAMESYS